MHTIQVRPALWRVVRTDGSLAGYIEQVPVADSARFEARRLVASTRRQNTVGDFSSIDDAVLCFG
ncbi:MULTISPECIES: hypothetical protein [Subtercola]|uniref:Uncharacterized protein n=1 Tax=Subtercola vilae TaxID=2056433 RepID=A0A4T2C742_9MICO|nr:MULTISPECIES: hypothetical protein [Subtercola]MEA9986209.1 hypothetical protein [Subtercola sp. RTI3]TIH38326.1 hypothetical protein D4765_07050 [Subtercola vilae]